MADLGYPAFDPMVWADELLDSVPAALKACGTSLSKCRLLLLSRRLMLLLGLLPGSRVLPLALSACGYCTHRGTRARVPADDLAYNSTAYGTSCPGTRGCPGCSRRWRCRLLLRWWLGRIKTALLDRPGMAGRLITLLLLRRLPLCRINVLLCASFAGQCHYPHKHPGISIVH